MEAPTVGDLMNSERESGNVVAKLRELYGQRDKLSKDDQTFVQEVLDVRPYTALSRHQILRIMDIVA
jgi:hypothetical protein